MLGIYLNLVLIALAVLSLAAGISFCINASSPRYIRHYTLFFGIASALICGGYALMAFTPDTDKAWIPRLVGLYGVDVFLLMEFTFLMTDMKIPTSKKYFPSGAFGVYLILDMMIHGDKNTLAFIRDFGFTYYVPVNSSSHLFHYSYVTVIGITLFVCAIFWYRKASIRRDKLFIIKIVSANFLILFSAIPDIMGSRIDSCYRSVGYCTAFAIVFFMWWQAVSIQSEFTPTIKNISKDIFNTLDIPVFIFNLDQSVTVFNLQAKKLLLDCDSQSVNECSLSDIFVMTDVEIMHLLARSRRGEDSFITVTSRLTQKKLNLKCTVKLDFTNEPYCVVGTISQLKEEYKKE
ncbi:hypothetical protein [Treponema sp.]|uniref:hypothetical protein n=1 Tax=Treponema sp. TaxID=166 RepID=UPI0025F6A1A8|nr:hypothetical protein [Treponema sp.]MCR5217214.1 hypothetical protein [Treponema sp.]